MQANGIELVIQQLCSQSLHAATHAGCVLANMAACNLAAYHHAIAGAGALLPLVALLKQSPEEQSAALMAIRNLSSDVQWQVRMEDKGLTSFIASVYRGPPSQV